MPRSRRCREARIGCSQIARNGGQRLRRGRWWLLVAVLRKCSPAHIPGARPCMRGEATAVCDDIERFFNRQRFCVSLDWLSPIE